MGADEVSCSDQVAGGGGWRSGWYLDVEESKANCRDESETFVFRSSRKYVKPLCRLYYEESNFSLILIYIT